MPLYVFLVLYHHLCCVRCRGRPQICNKVSDGIVYLMPDCRYDRYLRIEYCTRYNLFIKWPEVFYPPAAPCNNNYLNTFKPVQITYCVNYLRRRPLSLYCRRGANYFHTGKTPVYYFKDISYRRACGRCYNADLFGEWWYRSLSCFVK